ncbi:dihydrolipoyl dehydrogenase family protein [Defluviitalea phaphyphila]|uniref:dihydrolipoyl dehydrogenase family protein n=1 Tax=Defluviitalea phaphyphila TaxID=1473580 RepID=UPI001A9A4803|nr:FAD-dependent oxidoreductase [Defluviitalea phaphyphila]
MALVLLFNALGSEVSVVEYLPSILSCVDSDVQEVVRESAFEKGIHIYDGAKAMGIRKTMNNKMVTEVEIEGERYLISSEKVLMAVGRRANLESLDYEKLGVQLNEKKNGIKVDEFMKTTNENIYAIGDITNKIQLAHVASRQGIVAAEHIAGIENPMKYDLVPSAIFTFPEIGTVGISETEAMKKGLNIKVSKFPFMASGKAIAMNETEGFVKLIVDKDKDIVLGGAVVGPHGTDLIGIITQIIHDKVKLEDALNVIYAHPTLGESIHEALLIADDRGIHLA